MSKMSKKTYLPQFAKEMHYLGKYAFDHRAKLFEAIDADERLNDEQKQTAKKVIDDIQSSHEIFRILNQPVYEK